MSTTASTASTDAEAPPSMPTAGRQPTEEDRTEFEQLYRRSRARAFNLARRLVRDRADAEDAAQDAFVRAWRHFHQYDRGRSFDNWLLRIVANVAFDRRFRRPRNQSGATTSLEEALAAFHGALPVGLTDVDADPQRRMMAATLSESLQQALDALSPAHRTVIMMADVEERTYEDIARTLGCPIGTVRSRIHRARQLLRDHLAQADG